MIISICQKKQIYQKLITVVLVTQKQDVQSHKVRVKVRRWKNMLFFHLKWSDLWWNSYIQTFAQDRQLPPDKTTLAEAFFLIFNLVRMWASGLLFYKTRYSNLSETFLEICSLCHYSLGSDIGRCKIVISTNVRLSFSVYASQIQ